MAGQPPAADLTDPSLYLNRELSWLSFNRHVLDEAMDESHPLLERVKFLAIFAGNLDEFFMIRVAGLQRQLADGVLEAPPDGMTPQRQLDAIRAALLPVLSEQAALWSRDLLPKLDAAGIRITACQALAEDQGRSLREWFIEEIFPVLTPLAFDLSHPFPFISNLSLNLAIIVRDGTGREFFARVKVPTGLFSRLVRVPAPGGAHGGRAGTTEFVFLEDLISRNADLLFPGMTLVAAHPFRITRDADLEIEEDEASDLLTAVEESVDQRRTGTPVRIEVGDTMPEAICRMLERQLHVPPSMLYRSETPPGLADMMQIPALDSPDLKDPPFIPFVPAGLSEGRDLFAAVRKGDVLLFHPYDSFAPVVSFLRQAAHDPDVLAIKITLYRVGSKSPIVAALMEARENGKAVSALIELKARFDEENNIGWARQLERAGVHVVYGIRGLKVHAKVCMVVRREKDGIRRYVHLGTGNYNAASARIYTDFGLFTADPVIGADVADLFNFLTGYARIEEFRTLAVAPVTLRRAIIARIGREVERHRAHGDGHLVFKMNALVDRDCIAALYAASQAGVKIDLQVRGICCLRPALSGVSETIRVNAVVGRFLEHARLYYFHNGGEGEILMGSADLMPRNLDRRVEVLFPVQDPAIRAALTGTVIPRLMADTRKARTLRPDGTYGRARPAAGEEPFDAQSWFVANRGVWHHGRR